LLLPVGTSVEQFLEFSKNRQFWLFQKPQRSSSLHERINGSLASSLTTLFFLKTMDIYQKWVLQIIWSFEGKWLYTQVDSWWVSVSHFKNRLTLVGTLELTIRGRATISAMSDLYRVNHHKLQIFSDSSNAL